MAVSQLQETVPVVGEESVDDVEIQPQTEVAFAQSENLPAGNNGIANNGPTYPESGQQPSNLQSSIEPEIVHLVTTLVGQGFADAGNQQYEVSTSSSDAHQVPIQPQELEANTTDLSYDSFSSEQQPSTDKSSLTDAISGKGRTRKLYPIKLKLEVVEYAKTHSKQATARYFSKRKYLVCIQNFY